MKTSEQIENSVLGHSHSDVNFTVYRAMITKPKVC